MIDVGIVGASGYSGLELLKLLINHPAARIVKLFGTSSSGKRIEDVHPSLRRLLSMEISELSTSSLDGIEVLFIALPSGHSMSLVPGALAAGCKVIDLGGDFRLKDAETYRQFYGHEHTAESFLGEAVYGLSEWNCDEIRKARLLANPGCYPTSIQLALLPLLSEGLMDRTTIGITSYSGTSGAGKSVSEQMLFTEVNDNVRAYKAGRHQHTPEIRTYLEAFGGQQVAFTFVPHLLPVNRGIYTTIHASVKDGVTQQHIAGAFENRYASSPFVRLVPTPGVPEIKNVLHTNFCDIGFVLGDDGLVVFSTIDNLGKGAAGQAIQNMNLMFDRPQTEGLLLCSKM